MLCPAWKLHASRGNEKYSGAPPLHTCIASSSLLCGVAELLGVERSLWAGHLCGAAKAGDMQDKAIAHHHSDGVPGISAITLILSSWRELYRKATACHYPPNPL